MLKITTLVHQIFTKKYVKKFYKNNIIYNSREL